MNIPSIQLEYTKIIPRISIKRFSKFRAIPKHLNINKPQVSDVKTAGLQEVGFK